MKTVRARQLQLLEKMAIKPEPMDISTSGSWNTGEGTSRGSEHNQLAPREKLRRRPMADPTLTDVPCPVRRILLLKIQTDFYEYR